MAVPGLVSTPEAPRMCSLLGGGSLDHFLARSLWRCVSSRTEAGSVVGKSLLYLLDVAESAVIVNGSKGSPGRKNFGGELGRSRLSLLEPA